MHTATAFSCVSHMSQQSLSIVLFQGGEKKNCSTSVLHACTERDRFDMTETRYNQKYKYDLNQNRWPLKVKHSNSIWLMGVKPQTAPFSFLWLRNAGEMLPQFWCSPLPSQCVSVFPMHIIRHLKGKQCIFTRHASLCAQTGAISAETEGWMYCNWLLQKITLFQKHQAISELHLTPQSAKEGSFSATHFHWHAVCKTITMSCCLIFVPTLVQLTLQPRGQSWLLSRVVSYGQMEWIFPTHVQKLQYALAFTTQMTWFKW